MKYLIVLFFAIIGTIAYIKGFEPAGIFWLVIAAIHTKELT